MLSVLRFALLCYALLLFFVGVVYGVLHGVDTIQSITTPHVSIPIP